MLKKTVGLFLVMILCIGIFSACSKETSKTDGGKAKEYTPEKLTIGFVPSQNAETLEARAKPLAELLSKEIGIPVDVKVTTDYNSVVEAMGSKQLDLGFLPPTDYVIAHDKGYADVLLQALRYGVNPADGSSTKELVEYYYSGILTLKDSPINSLEDLKGKKIGWQSPTSSAGYVWSAVEMKDKGIDAQKDVQGVQLQGHDKGVLAVLNKDVDAAAIFLDARNIVKKSFPDVWDKTKIVYTTQKIPNDTISVRPDMTQAWKDKIADAFVKISKDKEGQKIIEAIYTHVGYKKADDKNFDVVREYSKKIGQIGK
ncbi:phosphate/phosphite/phosphonate ABC transporter substrate-binding protein [Priestia taiwanensis]|uniref:Phosphonate ABC transporter substrate-binding protein n=1 Tax=Priestia taiwanensis TaxID=1347902 RepID=A0A917ALH6_9BACI|nr:phosphate/phosphite/phosphonate ABC transporter substrate-binding protein [Priestia taiwanensis]MBM7362047.1 phosphonate transport system substrate-binding protein [Priestia taiwanensis]GGE59029.1 phosphonate ABC transporter substrate-binding protein [Priestia taiwanensis]